MQHEKTVQPSKEEHLQTEPFQKTRDLAHDQLGRQVLDDVNSNPSLQNKDKNLESVESNIESQVNRSEQETNQQLEKAVEAGRTPEAQAKVEDSEESQKKN